jgi:hypothetical protein
LLLLALATLIPGLADGSAESLAPRLPDLLRRSALVVVADIVAVTEHDDGRLLQAHLRVDHALKGLKGSVETAGIGVVEDRKFPSVPPVLRAGGRVAVFLTVAPSTSQLRRSLRPGDYYRLLSDRWGLIKLPDAETEDAVLDVLNGWLLLERNGKQDEKQRAAETRRLVFSELGARSERLVEDAAAGLPELPDLAATLTASEQDALTRTLRRADLPERIRVGLVEAVADAKLRALAPVLGRLPSAGPELLRATAVARAQLGQPADDAEVEAALQDEDAAVRVAAVHGLAAERGGAIAKLGDIALNDPTRDVRLEAIEALGNIGNPNALPILGQTFADADRVVRQKSAQAIYRIGGRKAAELLAKLAFTAPSEGQQQAVALLMTMGIPQDDPLLARIRNTHPDPAVRDLAAHGLPAIHDH